MLLSRHFFNPHLPELKGLSSFPGTIVHSHLYREPEPFAGQTVLVIGVGQSGRDIILDLAPHVKVVYLCNRHDPLMCKLPDNVEDLPGITELKADGMVCFEDGRERQVDSIILATGYLYSYPFLTEDSGIKVENGKRVTPLYKHTFNAVHPSIAIVGVNFGFLPFPAFDLQVQWILSVWRGDKKLPDTQYMLKDIEETYQCRLREGLPPHKAGHYLGDTQWELSQQIAELGGVEPLDPVIEMLYNETRQKRVRYLMDYKSTNYRVVSKDSFCVVE